MGRKKQKRISEVNSLKNVFNEPFEMKGKWRKHFDKGDIVLELGCGRGHYTLELAEADSGRNFIGMDRKGDRIWWAAQEALENQMKNVAFVREHIEKLDDIFEPGEVDEIWITFPDPYPKPSKANRRLIAPNFLDIYAKVLKPGGRVHFKTDNDSLFEYGLEVLAKKKIKPLHVFFDIHEDERKKVLEVGLKEILEIRTFYEEKFRKKGHKISYLNFLLHQ